MSKTSDQQACSSVVLSATGFVGADGGKTDRLVGYAVQSGTTAGSVTFRNSAGGTILWQHAVSLSGVAAGRTDVAGLPFAIDFSNGIYASLYAIGNVSVAYTQEEA